MDKKQRVRKFGMIALVFAPLLFCIWFVFLNPHGFYNMFIKPRTYEPFTEEELARFCPALEEIGGYNVCIQEEIETEKDLYHTLEKLVANGHLDTFDEWDYYFFVYVKENCSEPSVTSQGISYYRCKIDFKDEPAFYRISLYFYENNELWELRESGGN